ncbi:MAG TPA: methyltransferase domain-containing protein [Bacteroidales bacterium]|jgi:SAM-dependent methyltransferase|nr:methyltransferase domain-containing protein [Bacteroidales bacterium]
MPDFRFRSKQTEMIDTSVPKDLLFQNLRELDFLNRNFGGHSASLEGLKSLMTDRDRTYHIVDLGCGGGDTLIQIAQWAHKSNLNVKLTGIDKNPDVIDYLRHRCARYPEISGIATDYKRFIRFGSTADIMHCSLFCHHLADEEILELLKYFKSAARVGFIVNDLVRSRMAYYTVKLFTVLANGSAIARNDGPVSVLRGFNINELHRFMKSASIEKYQISRKWAFRFLITGYVGLGN